MLCNSRYREFYSGLVDTIAPGLTFAEMCRTTAEGGFVGVRADVTELMRREQALGDSEQKYRLLFEGMVSGFALHEIICDEAGDPCDCRFLEVNPAFEKITGLGAGDIIGKRVLDVLPETEPHWIKTYGEVALTGEPAHFENYHQGLDKYFEVTAFSPRLGQFAVTFTDVTERRQAADTLRRLNVELDQRVRQRTAELEVANRELEAFTYAVSHDLRAPLRTIGGFSQALAQDYGEALDGKALDYLAHLRNGATEMGQLIDDLLKLSRLTRGEMNRQEVRLSDIVAEVAGRLRKTEPGRDVTFDIAKDVVVNADPRLLRLAMENLIGNAWKFSRDEKPARIEFGREESDGGPIFFIRDNGAGFDMAYSDKLFQPFQRLHRADEFEGTGIGLSTVQRVIHRHGGRIWLQSAVGDGTTVFFGL